MTTQVKICGIKDEKALRAAINYGADFIGFVFFEKSPRYISPQNAALLCNQVNDLENNWQKVALLVNPSDEYIIEVMDHLNPNIIQLHGKEDVSRINGIKTLINHSAKIMKCFSISNAEDLKAVNDFIGIADYMLFDAKSPKGSELPGGNAVSFDWNLLSDFNIDVPWMLAGGLNANNVTEAITKSNAKIVDVSSGVEDVPGIKNIDKIKEFIKKSKKC
jgi:phosphoribosylanthranilate isomerase